MTRDSEYASFFFVFCFLFCLSARCSHSPTIHDTHVCPSPQPALSKSTLLHRLSSNAGRLASLEWHLDNYFPPRCYSTRCRNTSLFSRCFPTVLDNFTDMKQSLLFHQSETYRFIFFFFRWDFQLVAELNVNKSHR